MLLSLLRKCATKGCRNKAVVKGYKKGENFCSDCAIELASAIADQAALDREVKWRLATGSMTMVKSRSGK